MVEFATPRITPTARAAGQVSRAGSQAINRLAGAAQGTADNFTEFFEKEAAIQGEQLLAEVQEEWSRTYNERAKTAGTGFTKGILNDYDQFVADKLAQQQTDAEARGQANVPERNRAEMDLALSKYRLKLETRALGREASVRAAAKAAAVANTRRLKLNALISDPTLLPEYLETAGPKERGDLVVTALGATLRNDPQGVRDQVMAGQWDADLKPSQKNAIIKLSDSGIARQERAAEIALKAEQRSTEAELQEEIAFAEANGAPPVDSIFDETDIQALYSNDPDRGAEVRETYRDAVAFAETFHSVSDASPDDIEMEVESLQGKVSTPGNTEQDVKNLNNYVAAVNARNTRIKTDPAEYAGEAVDGVGTLFDMVSNADPESAPTVAGHYVTALESTYDRLGVPAELRNILPKNAAADQVAQFNGMGSDVAAQALAQYAETWGDAAPRVLAQLDKAGLVKEYSVAMRHLDNPGLSQAIVNLAQIERKDLVAGLPTASVTAAKLALTEGMVDYRAAFEFAGSGDAQEMMNKHFAVADKMALDLIRRGSDPDDAVDRVLTQMFPEAVVQGNNERYILPVGLDETRIGTRTDTLMSAETLRGSDIAAINDPRFPDFADMEVTISAASRSGIWVNNSSGTGLQLMLSLDGYLLPLNNADGSAYEFTFEEIGAADAGGFRGLPFGGAGVRR